MTTSLMLYKKFSSCWWSVAHPKVYDDKSFKRGGMFLSIAQGKGDGTYDTDNAYCVFLSSSEVSEIISAIETNFFDYANNERNPYQYNAYHEFNGIGTGAEASLQQAKKVEKLTEKDCEEFNKLKAEKAERRRKAERKRRKSKSQKKSKRQRLIKRRQRRKKRCQIRNQREKAKITQHQRKNTNGS